MKFPNSFLTLLKSFNDKIFSLGADSFEKKKICINLGFFKNYDVFFRLKNSEGRLYSLYNNKIFHNDEDIEFLTLIKKYENKITVEHVDEYKNINIIPGGVFLWELNSSYPKKWRDFLLNFHSKHSQNNAELDIKFDYLIILLRALLRQESTILKCSNVFNGYIFVGYHLDSFYSSFFSYPHLILNDVLFNITSFEADKKINDITSSSYLNNFDSNFCFIQNSEKFFDDAGIFLPSNKKNNKFDFSILLNYETCKNALIPILLKILLDSFLYFPNIGIDPNSISAETQKEYKKIVDEEYEQILSFLICSDSYYGPIFSSLIQKELRK